MLSSDRAFVLFHIAWIWFNLPFPLRRFQACADPLVLGVVFAWLKCWTSTRCARIDSG
jgi:hypothetical protein